MSAASDGFSHLSPEHQLHDPPVRHPACVLSLWLCCADGTVQRCCYCSDILHTSSHLCPPSQSQSMSASIRLPGGPPMFLTTSCPAQSTTRPEGHIICMLCSLCAHQDPAMFSFCSKNTPKSLEMRLIGYKNQCDTEEQLHN